MIELLSEFLKKLISPLADYLGEGLRDWVAGRGAPLFEVEEDILFSYRNLNWNDEWPTLCRNAKEKQEKESVSKIWQSFSALNGAKVKEIVSEKEIETTINDITFDSLRKLGLLEIETDEKTFFLRNISAIAMISFFTIGLFGVTLGALIWIPATWIYAIWFQPEHISFKRITLTDLGKSFVSKELYPSLADYIRQKKL